jgi:hypothetical protein
MEKHSVDCAGDASRESITLSSLSGVVTHYESLVLFSSITLPEEMGAAFLPREARYNP